MLKAIAVRAVLFILFAITVCMGGVPGGGAAETASGGPKRYHVEAGMVVYELDGWQKGTQTVYFDRWGTREARYTTTEFMIMGQNQVARTLTLVDPEWIHTVDLDRRIATKMPNTVVKRFEGAAPPRDWVESGEIIMRRSGGRKIGRQAILGRRCAIWEVKSTQSKSWLWKGIPFRTEVRRPGREITMMATRFEEAPEIPPEKFALPPDVKVLDSAAISRMIQEARKD